MGVLTRVAEILKDIDRRRDCRARARAARQVLVRFSPPYNLHVGCGSVCFAGWVNIDAAPGPGVDLMWDVTEGLPVPDGSCECIYSEHFLEHLTVEQGIRFLRDCRRVLRPGGVMRVAMPSVAEPVRRYYENSWRENPALEEYGLTWIQTRAEYINVAFRHWGHQWLYDEEELGRRLREAGFERTSTVAWGESRHPLLAGRETRAETKLICEATT